MGAGAKYTPRMDTAEIAKRVRDDIKAEQQAGRLSHLVKVSVRTRRSTTSSALDIESTEVPFLTLSREHVEACHRDPYTFRPHLGRHTPRALALLEQLRAIAAAYRFDESDSRTDYSNCNFFLDVRIAGEVEAAEKGMYLEALLAADVAA